MRTHEWNALDHRDALILWPELPLLGVLVSVASRDGVYTLDDLRAEVQDSGELPPALRTVAEHLAAGTGVYDLTDLRRELRALPLDYEWRLWVELAGEEPPMPGRLL